MGQSDDKSSSPKEKKAKQKSQVKIVYKKKYIEGDHEEHIDERWLVSYSDMMTLLFGLFVMLYAMQDPEATKQMQESIKQKFTQESSETEVTPSIPPAALQAQIDNLTAQLAEQKLKAEETEQLRTRVADLDDEAKKLKEDLIKTTVELKKLEMDNQTKSRSIASIESEKKSIDDITKEKLEVEASLQAKKNELQIKTDEILKLKEELKEKTALIEKQQDTKELAPKKKDFEKEYLSEVDKTKILDQKNQDLEAKVKAMEQKGSFLAIVLNWTTNEHDLDLVVKDPNGKKFTFKAKQFANYPGKMVLDSRRGPGAEIWQADKVIAGTYEAEITFYNQYGNTASAEGKLVIFSTRGNVEIPDIKLDLSKNPKRSVTFEISQLGEIKLK